MLGVWKTFAPKHCGVFENFSQPPTRLLPLRYFRSYCFVMQGSLQNPIDGEAIGDGDGDAGIMS